MRNIETIAILLSLFAATAIAEPVVPPPQAPASQAQIPVQAAPLTPDQVFCSSVARQDAATGGFDASTQAAVYARSYAQCLAMRRP